VKEWAAKTLDSAFRAPGTRPISGDGLMRTPGAELRRIGSNTVNALGGSKALMAAMTIPLALGTLNRNPQDKVANPLFAFMNASAIADGIKQVKPTKDEKERKGKQANAIARPAPMLAGAGRTRSATSGFGTTSPTEPKTAIASALGLYIYLP